MNKVVWIEFGKSITCPVPGSDIISQLKRFRSDARSQRSSGQRSNGQRSNGQRSNGQRSNGCSLKSPS